jgi:hypothetical protein
MADSFKSYCDSMKNLVINDATEHTLLEPIELLLVRSPHP